VSVLADLLVRLAPDYRRSRAVSGPQARALAQIGRCRTPALGGQVYRCGACGEADFGYHSCHHRACPRCGGGQTADWTKRQTERLLPVPYFLVTFTLPEPVKGLALVNPPLLYDLLFTESARALQQVAARPGLLGAELGFVGVLHTWNRQLGLHPHVHYIVPGGGLRADRKKWRRCRKPDWFLPVKALSAAFRQGMDEALRAAAPQLHAQVPDSVWRGVWVVHCQPAGSGEAVVKYLARYVFRTAIGDERIVEAADGSVTFSHVDRESGEKRLCRVDNDEFMRRYLLHVPPPGLHRVRYFGWMHPAAKARRLIVETLLAIVIVVRAKSNEPSPWHLRCPHCEAFALVVVATLPRGPPVCKR
jgi:hypothetical protein